jgi:hypothetical protein
MTTSSRSPRVFLSYADDDAEHAMRLRPLLKVAGFDPWLDSNALSPQEPLEAAMADAMASSDFVVALLSGRTRSSHQEREIRCAIDVGRRRLLWQTVDPAVRGHGNWNGLA